MGLSVTQGSVSTLPNLPAGVSSHFVEVGQIRTHYLEAGVGRGATVVLIHSGEFWRAGRVQLALQHRAARRALPRLRPGPGRFRPHRPRVQLQRCRGVPAQARRRVPSHDVPRPGAPHRQLLRRRLLPADGDGPALRRGLGHRRERWRQGARQRRTQDTHRLHRRARADAQHSARVLLQRALVGRRRGGGALEGQPGAGGVGGLRGCAPGALGTASRLPSRAARLRPNPLPGADRGRRPGPAAVPHLRHRPPGRDTGSEVKVFENSRHCSHAEHPEEFNALAIDFIKRHAGEAQGS